MFTNNAVTYDVWDDVTSDCQNGHVINSGTILSWNHFNFMLFLTLKIWKIGQVLAKLQRIKPGVFFFWDTVY